MTDLAILTRAEQIALDDCEQRIERGIKTFVEVGHALGAIRDSKLYRGTHETFEAYARERWNLSRTRSYELMAAAEVVSAIADTGQTAPANEGQARELAKVPEPERAEVWRETVEQTDGKPTAAAIREVRTKRTQTPEPTGPAIATPTVGSGSTERPPFPGPDPRATVAAALDKHVPDPDAPARAWRKAFYDQHAPASKFLSWLDVDDFVRFATVQDVETVRLYASMVSDFYDKALAQLAGNDNVTPLRRVR